MAGIDKTYTNSYKEYKQFKDWANDNTITFFDGLTICIGDYVEEYEEKDFLAGEIPIMNSPTWLDIYLIQNCKIDFIINRMKAVYPNSVYDKFKTIDLTSKPPDDYKQNRKVIIFNNVKTKFPLHSKPYGGKAKWWLQCYNHDFVYDNDTKKWINDNFVYNSITKTWINDIFSFYPTNTDTAHLSSVKSVIRHLRKQYLPSNLTFALLGTYVGEEYNILII